MKKLTKREKTTVTKLRLGKDDWYLIIHSVRDGYILEPSDGDLISIGSRKGKEIIANEDLLQTIIDYFGMRASRYEREVLSIIREVGEKYFLQPGEKLVKKYYEAVKEEK